MPTKPPVPMALTDLAELAMRRAFTLAELLVVFCIVLLLSGMLIQAVIGVMRMANRTACMNNLRQVAAAITMYANDNAGWYPAEGNKGYRNPAASPAWFHRLPAYTDGMDARSRNSVFQCPAYNWEAPEIFDHASPKSYKMNGYLDKPGRGTRRWSYHQGRWSYESAIVLFVDAVAGETGMGQWGHCPTSAVTDERHPGAVNVLYLDGHSQSCVDTPEDLRHGRPDWREGLNWTQDQVKSGHFK